MDAGFEDREIAPKPGQVINWSLRYCHEPACRNLLPARGTGDAACDAPIPLLVSGPRHFNVFLAVLGPVCGRCCRPSPLGD
jgi:hypothetical protein